MSDGASGEEEPHGAQRQGDASDRESPWGGRRLDAAINRGGAEAALRAYAWLALAALALTFTVVVASAFLRHSQAGLSCDPWPACYARADASDAPPTAGVRTARVVHRISATAVTAAILGLMLVAWTQRPVWLREAVVATGALAVAGALAILGVITAGSKAPAVVLGNLLGGYALLALVACACAYGFATGAATPRGRVLALSALALAVVVALLGGSIGAQYASVACPTFACDVRSTSFDWLRPPAIVDGTLRAPDWAPALHVAHRVAAIVLVVVVLITAFVLRRDRPRLASALIVAIAGAALLGIGAVSPQPSLAIVVLHNVGAAATLSLLAAAGAGSGRRRAIHNDQVGRRGEAARAFTRCERKPEIGPSVD